MSTGSSGGARRRPPGVDVDLYAVLGVTEDTSQAELRRRYLDLAREHHPDHHASDPAERRRAELRMQEINEAWTVLGDSESRALYDRDRRRDKRVTYRPGTVSPEFVPFDDGEDPEDPAAVHDVPYADGSPVHRGMQVGPAAMVVVGILAFGSGMLVDFGPLLALGIVAVVAGVLAFLATPFYAVMRAHNRTKD